MTTDPHAPADDANGETQPLPSPQHSPGAIFSPYPTMTSENPFDSRAMTVLVLGVLGMIACPLCAPIAWGMGNVLKREAEAAGFPEPFNATIGRICGIIVTTLAIIVLLVVAVGALVLAAQ